MQFKAFERGIEVNGQTVFAIVDGFGAFSLLAGAYLLKAGIGERQPDGTARIVPTSWYSQEGWLSAFESVAREIGETALFDIGRSIPKNAKFPPWVTDLDSAIRSIDVAYHLNHRKAGKEMFDPATGTMLEGIGHYGYERIAGKNRIVSACNNPYPCSFDHGIVTAMATRFAPKAKVEHDRSAGCRRSGADACTYLITW